MQKVAYILMLLSFLSSGQEAAKLRLNLKKGDKYLTIVTTISPNSLTKKTTNYEELEVKEASDNAFLVELKINKIIVNTINNSELVNYDSSKEESQMSSSERGLHSRFKPALNTVISETISKTAVSSNRKNVSGPLNAKMASQKTNLIQLPEEPVALDSQWIQDIINGTIAIQYTYLVTDITATKVYLECLGIPKGVLKGTVEGRIELDSTTGIPTRKEMKLDLDLNGQVIQSEVIIAIEKL
jgi:hypothetical protein